MLNKTFRLMKVKRQNVGVDVSKGTLASCLVILDEDFEIKIKASRTFPNNAKGFTELLSWADRKKNGDIELSFTMEPTGVYYEGLAYYLFEKKQIVHVVLPNRAKKYADSLQEKVKTDKQDAKSLGRLGVERKLKKWSVGSPVYRKLKVLTRERNALIKERTVFQNQLHALNHSADPFKKTVTRLKQMIRFINKQIKTIEKDCENIVDKDEMIKAKVDKVTTIPGVGFTTAIVVIAETHGFTLITSIKQLVSYAGLDIMIRESGKWKGKSKITKKGNVQIRKALYFPSYSSVKYSETSRKFYERLFERKGKSMIAATAVQRKLLGLIYTLWKNDTTYVENYQQSKAA